MDNHGNNKENYEEILKIGVHTYSYLPSFETQYRAFMNILRGFESIEMTTLST